MGNPSMRFIFLFIFIFSSVFGINAGIIERHMPTFDQGKDGDDPGTFRVSNEKHVIYGNEPNPARHDGELRHGEQLSFTSSHPEKDADEDEYNDGSIISNHDTIDNDIRKLVGTQKIPIFQVLGRKLATYGFPMSSLIKAANSNENDSNEKELGIRILVDGNAGRTEDERFTTPESSFMFIDGNSEGVKKPSNIARKPVLHENLVHSLKYSPLIKMSKGNISPSIIRQFLNIQNDSTKILPIQGTDSMGLVNKRSPACLRKCIAKGILHPAQCHSLC